MLGLSLHHELTPLFFLYSPLEAIDATLDVQSVFKEVNAFDQR